MPSKSRGHDQDRESMLSQLAMAYRFALRTNPVLIKSLTNGVLASVGNVIAQCIVPHLPTGKIVWRNVAAFGAFGVAVSGPVSHYFHQLLRMVLPRSSVNYLLKCILADRLVFTPPFLLAFFFIVAMLEGCSVEEAKRRVQLMYWVTLKINWQLWTVAQLVNAKYVPEKYRLLYGNIVTFLWNIFMATRR